MYTISRHSAEISVPEFIEKFVDVDTFLEACKACANYGKVWSCPPYDFDVIEYWNRYKTFRVVASKIAFDEETTSKTYTQSEIETILTDVLFSEKERLSDELYALEKEFPGSISLSAGCCQRCKNGCQKALGHPCIAPEKLRYSIESLGGNVGLTIEKLIGIKLEWIEEGRLPNHFVLVSGLLIP